MRDDKPTGVMRTTILYRTSPAEEGCIRVDRREFKHVFSKRSC